LGGILHPFGPAKPLLLRRGREVRLRVNLEQASRIHAGGVERFTPSAEGASFRTVKGSGTYVLKGGRYEEKRGFLINDSVSFIFHFVI
jgi:hypothetical protein